MIATVERTGVRRVNGTDLYHEVRGSGPALLLIQGATGDAGYFEPLADRLAETHTVLTYDRRGNSRSPRPPGWTTTSISEQADDAAGLIEELGIASAVVFGTSAGATIAFDLVARRPDLLRGALFHEPVIYPTLPDPGAVGVKLQAMMEEGMARGGPAGAMELFLRHYATEPVFELFSPELRTRVLANAELFLTVEMQPIVSFVPDIAAIKATGLPIAVLLGGDSGHYDDIPDEVAWLSAEIDIPVTEVPGAHAVYVQDPDGWVSALTPILNAMQ